jgi:hypothetical protein
LLGEKFNNKHPNSKMVVTKTPNVEDRFASFIETKDRKKMKTKHHNIRLINPS